MLKQKGSSAYTYHLRKIKFENVIELKTFFPKVITYVLKNTCFHKYDARTCDFYTDFLLPDQHFSFQRKMFRVAFEFCCFVSGLEAYALQIWSQQKLKYS